jgi:hypothetical protein
MPHDEVPGITPQGVTSGLRAQQGKTQVPGQKTWASPVMTSAHKSTMVAAWMNQRITRRDLAA